MTIPRVALVVVIAAQLIFAVAATAAIVQPSAGAGCAEMRAEQRCARGNGTQSSVDVAFSPDSRHLYVAAGAEDYGSLLVFRHSPAGAIRQLRGRAGCISGDGRNGQAGLDRKQHIGVKGRCARARGLHQTNAVAVSPDARFVYAASGSFIPNRATITAFARNPSTGRLMQLAGAAGCHSSKARAGCAGDLPALSDAYDVAISADGTTLAVATGSGGLVLDRNVQTGDLSMHPGGCLASAPGIQGASGCTVIAGMRATQVALSADGSLLVAGGGHFLDEGTVVSAHRRADGSYGVASCFSASDRSECTKLGSIAAVPAVAIAPDGRTAYVSSYSITEGDEGVPDAFHFSVLLGFSVGADGMLTPSTCFAAVGNAPIDGCASAHGFTNASGFAFSADGTRAFVAWTGTFSAPSRLGRSSGAEELDLAGLARLECVADVAAGGCKRGRGMGGDQQVAVSRDGSALALSSAFGADASFRVTGA